jgi:hypothetical protein
MSKRKADDFEMKLSYQAEESLARIAAISDKIQCIKALSA